MDTPAFTPQSARTLYRQGVFYLQQLLGRRLAVADPLIDLLEPMAAAIAALEAQWAVPLAQRFVDEQCSPQGLAACGAEQVFATGAGDPERLPARPAGAGRGAKQLADTPDQRRQ